ncbi:hypothetical protein HPB48_002450 [Haemaphysalis longicornis]|uniref:Uncharacterized protein n=1 Tax=Haemaphysalis longicornis TaxID=44386 RepID=A0A9J6FAQ7_HAELO|nr:hypothetical protein HPB48_002450 [Haemaphysalis longicornis]
MDTSGPREGFRSPRSRHQTTPTTIVMKFTDYTNLSNIDVGAVSFCIHRAAGLSIRERADTFIKVRKRQNLIALVTYRVSAANKLLAIKKLTVLGNVHTVTCYKALDPSNTRGVLHGVPQSYSREQIRSSLRIPGHKILDFRRMGESQSILITIEGHILPRQAIFCSAVARLYPPRVYCRPCLHCFGLQHRTDVCPTRKEFVRCSDCGTKFPPNQDPTDTPHDCELHCVNCHGDHSATDPSCQALRDATEELRNLNRSIRNRHRYGLSRTSTYGDVGALPRMSPSYRHTPLDRSRTSSRTHQAALNSTLGGDRLRERTCSRREQWRNQPRQGRKRMPSDPTPVRLQPRHGDLGTTPEHGRIARAATSAGSGQVVSALYATPFSKSSDLRCYQITHFPLFTHHASTKP